MEQNVVDEHQPQTILNKTNQRFFLCDCNSEALLCSRFEGDDEKEIYISIYTCGQFNKKPSIFERIKYCWYHLKTGKKYEDQIILSFDKAQQVSDWLSQNAR
jgi:hypothetical protein